MLRVRVWVDETPAEDAPWRLQLGDVRGAAPAVVVGAGPAGLFAALRLIEGGLRPIVLERGRTVRGRRLDVARLNREGAIDPESNYCFGEGGAGTFSDGKLYTRVKDRRGVRSVLHTLVEHGGDPGLMVESRPHVGSNLLPKLLVAQRTALEARGATYLWSEAVIDLVVAGGRVIGVRCASGREVTGDAVVLAVGHSARAHGRSVALQLYVVEQLGDFGAIARELVLFAVGACQDVEQRVALRDGRECEVDAARARGQQRHAKSRRIAFDRERAAMIRRFAHHHRAARQ